MRTLQDAKRREILAAAAAVFAAKGFHQTLMDDVASRAGIGKGTIYRYFTDKEDLFFSVLDTGMEELLSNLRLAGNVRMAPDRKLAAMVETLIDFGFRNRPLHKLLPEIEQEQLRKRVNQIHHQNKAVVALVECEVAAGIKAGLFRKGDAHLWARMITILTRAVFGPFGHGKRINRRVTVQALNEFFLHGIAAERKQNPSRARNTHITRI